MKRKKTDAPAKINMSSLQVLKTFQILMEDNYTMAELIQRLNENEDEPVFNNSVISKYINTCRYCGVKIHKIHNKYFLSSIPFGMELSESEYNLIKDLQNYVEQNFSVNTNKNFAKFLLKLNKISNKQIIRAEEDAINTMCTLFENAVKNGHKIILMLKNKRSIKCTPVEFNKYGEEYVFRVYYNDKEQAIPMAKVSGFEVITEEFKMDKKNYVIFKLTGDLAKNYGLRENEKMVMNSLPKYVSVSNDNEDLSLLKTRLLRYGNLCEVQSPDSFRASMAETVNRTLANYGE